MPQAVKSSAWPAQFRKLNGLIWPGLSGTLVLGFDSVISIALADDGSQIEVEDEDRAALDLQEFISSVKTSDCKSPVTPQVSSIPSPPCSLSHTPQAFTRRVSPGTRPTVPV
ncbi:hypothetical protein BDD12DRAFT_896149 [Trichophaea hybrida]|nr:hypothetical protein BDD12DRAFT_896149 [Trichophaea hybrida]